MGNEAIFRRSSATARWNGSEMNNLNPIQARFKRRATAVPNSIDRIKFDFSTALARRLKPSRAIAV